MTAESRVVSVEQVAVGRRQTSFAQYIDKSIVDVAIAKGKDAKARVLDQVSQPLLDAFLEHGVEGFHTLRYIEKGLEGAEDPASVARAAFLHDVLRPHRVAAAIPPTKATFDYLFQPKTQEEAEENADYLMALLKHPLERFKAQLQGIKLSKNDPQRDFIVTDGLQRAVPSTIDTYFDLAVGLVQLAEKDDVSESERNLGRSLLKRMTILTNEKTKHLTVHDLFNIAIADERIIPPDQRNKLFKKIVLANFIVLTSDVEQPGVVESTERRVHSNINAIHVANAIEKLTPHGYKGTQSELAIQQNVIDTYLGPFTTARLQVEQAIQSGERYGRLIIPLNDEVDRQVGHITLAKFIRTAYTKMAVNRHPAFRSDRPGMLSIHILPGESEVMTSWGIPMQWDEYRPIHRQTLEPRVRSIINTYPKELETSDEPPTGERKNDVLEGHALASLFLGLGPKWLHTMGTGYHTPEAFEQYTRQISLQENKRQAILTQGKFLRLEGQFVGEQSLPKTLKAMGLERIDYHIGNEDTAVQAILRFRGAELTQRDSETGAIKGLHVVVNLDGDFRIIGHDFLKAKYKFVYEYLHTVALTGLEAIRRKKIDIDEDRTPRPEPEGESGEEKEAGSNVDHLEVLPLGYRADLSRVLEYDRNVRLIQQCRGIYGISRISQLPWNPETKQWTDAPPLVRLLEDFIALQEGMFDQESSERGMTPMQLLSERDPKSAGQIQGFLDTIAVRPEREAKLVYEAQLFLQQKVPTEPTEVYCPEDMNVLQ